jgi:glucose/arabinose dehydrogenase
VRFNGEGQPIEIEDFVSGFLIEDGRAHFGRLADVAIAADGALLFSEDTNGIIYRVDYEGGGADDDAG